MTRSPPVALAGARRGRPAGAGIAVLVNANAKRGGRRVAVQIARALAWRQRAPDAQAARRSTSGSAPCRPRARSSPRAATARRSRLVNALARVTPPFRPLPIVGVLPLGTGNGWAHALGAPKLHRCLDLLAGARGPLPTRACGLFEVEGTLAHFAGSGLGRDDPRRLPAAARREPRARAPLLEERLRLPLGDAAAHRAAGSRSTATPGCSSRTSATRCSRSTRAAALTASTGVAPRRGPLRRHGRHGLGRHVPGVRLPVPRLPLRRAHARAASTRASTTRSAVGAVASIPRLWQGSTRFAGMHDWLATHVRMTFSREVPLQIGGDACGMRRTVEYRASNRTARMVDWRRLQCLAG